MTGPDPAWDPWTDQSYLRESQYKTDVNLAARQSICAYQQPRIDLARETLSLAALGGEEIVADVGCGNGRYLAELARRGHAGPVLGVDMSPGMLLAARSGAPRASLMVADAMALPGEQLLRSQFTSVTRHDFEGQLRVPDAEPIAAYVRSRVLDAGPLVPAVLSALPADPALFPITTHSGCLVCA